MAERLGVSEEKNDQLEQDLNLMERKRRANNLRVSNLKNNAGKNENSKESVAKFILDNNLLRGYNHIKEITAEIEFAFRVGQTDSSKPRQLLVRFYDKLIRDEVMRSSKNKNKVNGLKPTFLQDDMTPADLRAKAEAWRYMQWSHKTGRTPRFYDGMVKVTDLQGKKHEIPRTTILAYNKKYNIKIDQRPKRGREPPTSKIAKLPRYERPATADNYRATRNHPSEPTIEVLTELPIMEDEIDPIVNRWKETQARVRREYERQEKEYDEEEEEDEEIEENLLTSSEDEDKTNTQPPAQSDKDMDESDKDSTKILEKSCFGFSGSDCSYY